MRGEEDALEISKSLKGEENEAIAALEVKPLAVKKRTDRLGR